MDKLQWFKFSPSDWMMGKIQRVPEITQLRFIRLVCLYWNKECILSVDDAEIEIDKDHLDLLITKKVIKIFNGKIVIDFMNEQLEDVGLTSAERKKAANKRWNNHRENLQNDANVLQTDASAMQNDAEERREEEKRKKEANKHSFDWDELILYFNTATGKKTRVIPDKVKASFKARLKEGYTKEEIAAAITNCANNQFHKDNNYKDLTLEFISRSDKLDKYSTLKPLTKTA